MLMYTHLSAVHLMVNLSLHAYKSTNIPAIIRNSIQIQKPKLPQSIMYSFGFAATGNCQW